MIQLDHLKAMLAALGFEQNQQVWHKRFAESSIELKVDVEHQLLIYPEVQGLIINARQTCNFAAAENAVVFECVHRLLEKGYKPEHIELEPKWKLGHGTSGGRADILVRDHQGQPLLIIECKTFDKEFEKAWRDTQQDGGQLFSYIEQEKATQFVCLYASTWNASTQQIDTQQKIISVKDNPKVLQDNPSLAAFATANNNKERFRVWKDTYQLEATETGLFEDNILPYQIGKNKYALDMDTKTIQALDIKGAYHKFRTILRKHNVSRRENAFEVLVNLFLCKIVDELSNPNDLNFYWKGMAYDSYFDLVDRLQRLYKIGMERFLGQDIVYVSNEDIDGAFWAFKQKPNATEERIKELFRQLKFFKGLDFEFIKVSNQHYFEKNAKILLEMIQMWQGYRLTGSEQNQFLGDMFEYFLDNGIKQSEGQFFTPVPICKFVVSALPLEHLIAHNPEPIRALDYACGSGHFLTEYAQQIPALIRHIKQIDHPSEYYRAIYGIEKEDRLAKVAKVAAFMYGYNDIQVIDADALVQHQQIESASFDVLVANPPFAVEDFLRTIDEGERDRYALMRCVGELGNKNIQCFFLERAEQLMAAGGVVGVIVPSSVLSNSDNMHVKTREIVLQSFDVVSIVELGSQTFGKTGTNTVVLFLRRKGHNPTPAAHYAQRVRNFFDDWQKEQQTGGGVYDDLGLVRQYCAHVGLDFTHYQSLLLGDACAELLSTERFTDYRAAFEQQTEIVNLKKSKGFKAKTEVEQQLELQKRFNVYVREIEQDKLYYFMLASANPCSVLVVKSPSDNKEQKQFLGYEWSSAKGNEGVKYNGGDTVYDIQTPLFDPKNRDNQSKISHVIRQNFLGELASIPEVLEPLVSRVRLVDMLDFERTVLDKSISFSRTKQVDIKSQWPIVKLSSVVEIVSGGTPNTNNADYWDGDIPWLSVADFNNQNRFVERAEKSITQQGLENSSTKILNIGDLIISARGTVGALAQIATPMAFNQSCYGLRPHPASVDAGWLYYVLVHQVEQFKNNSKGMTFGAITISTFDDIRIPLPPLDVQQNIVQECEAVDEMVKKSQENMLNLSSQISDLIESVQADDQKISSIAQINPSRSEIKAVEDHTIVSFVEMAAVSEKGFISSKIDRPLGELKKGSYTYFAENDVIVAKITPCMENGKCALATGLTNHIGMGSTEFHVLRAGNQLNSKYLFLFINRDVVRKNAESHFTGSSGHRRVPASFYENLMIPVPPLAEQEALVAQIETLEAQIAQAQAVIDAAPAQKQAILKKYL